MIMRLSRSALLVSLALCGFACGGSTSTSGAGDAGSTSAASPNGADPGASDAGDAGVAATADAASDGDAPACPPGTAYDGENTCQGGRLVPMCCQIGGGCDSFGFCAFNDGTCTECPAAGCTACPPPGSAH